MNESLMVTQTRAEHLLWCKSRALAICATGDVVQAFSSMVSDLGKHDGTRDHTAIEMGTLLLLMGDLNTPAKMAEFIEGFN